MIYLSKGGGGRCQFWTTRGSAPGQGYHSHTSFCQKKHRQQLLHTTFFADMQWFCTFLSLESFAAEPKSANFTYLFILGELCSRAKISQFHIPFYPWRALQQSQNQPISHTFLSLESFAAEPKSANFTYLFILGELCSRAKISQFHIPFYPWRALQQSQNQPISHTFLSLESFAAEPKSANFTYLFILGELCSRAKISQFHIPFYPWRALQQSQNQPISHTFLSLESFAAEPKSANFTCPVLSISILSGFTSLQHNQEVMYHFMLWKTVWNVQVGTSAKTCQSSSLQVCKRNTVKVKIFPLH